MKWAEMQKKLLWSDEPKCTIFNVPLSQIAHICQKPNTRDVYNEVFETRMHLKWK